ncbi:hypothetical protein POM88_021412 [Heracleum sosnowskyi]|uniref:Replication protein A subunit n=1 Tax=Heracleum sosnowskyi TaxID=360622 RepID=A0AAD8ID58_9APIA|nr:hypothetical protein POM88_021412 [Heracleum sosnowskyi]
MSQYTMLSALTPQSETASLLVRVGRVWQAINRNNNAVLHTNVVLIDEQENHIMGIVRNNQKEMFKSILSENGVFHISNIKLVPGPKLYRTVDRDLAINFFYKTKIEKKPDTGLIPQYKFELQPFQNVNSLVGDVRSLIDVLGMVSSYGQLEKRSNGAKKIDAVLNNAGNEKVVVTLWEERADEFLAAVADTNKSPLFVVITGLLAKKFSARASLSSTDATRSYFNIDYTPLKNLKHEISNASGTPVDTLPPPTIRHFVTGDEEDIQEISIKSILEAQIPHGKDLLRFFCKAKIIGILDGNGWYYICCSKCARAVKQLEGKYYCAHCVEESSSYTQRYRVVIHVEDASGTTSFTLFNKEAEQLIGIPMQKILTEIEENDNVTQIPAAIRNIVGKVCTFQIKVNKYNITHACEEYAVTRVLESSPLPNSDPHTDSVAALNKKQRTS